jgi:hypothetical protein
MEIAWQCARFIHLSATGVAEIAESTLLNTFGSILYICVFGGVLIPVYVCFWGRELIPTLSPLPIQFRHMGETVKRVPLTQAFFVRKV